jgi:peptidylprolyl isomerase
LILAAAMIAAVACRGGGSNPSAGDQVLPVIQPTVSDSNCLNTRQPDGAPQFADIDFDRFTAAGDGLRFYDIVEGTGDSPAAFDAVTAEYAGWLDDGCMFDSSFLNGQPATFPLINVIPGWQQTFVSMQVGGTRVVEIPPALAYEEVGLVGVIPPNATLYFYVNLVDNITLEDAQATVTAGNAEATATAESVEATIVAGGGVVPTASLPTSCVNSRQPAGAPTFDQIDPSRFEPLANGLRYYEIEAGSGDSPSLTDTVSVEYTGWTDNGCMFDTSYPDDGPISFPLSAVISGWQQGLSEMKVGSTWVLEISPDLGYGDRGSAPNIPPGATLIFHVNLIGK